MNWVLKRKDAQVCMPRLLTVEFIIKMIFHFSQLKHMLWVHKSTFSLIVLFRALKRKLLKLMDNKICTILHNFDL